MMTAGCGLSHPHAPTVRCAGYDLAGQWAEAVEDAAVDVRGTHEFDEDVNDYTTCRCGEVAGHEVHNTEGGA